VTAPVVSESLLRYRPWRGDSAGPLRGSWALARTSFRLMLRKKAFWALVALAAMIFFFFFYGQYLIVWVGLQAGQQSVSFGGIPIKLDGLQKFLDRLNLNGSPHTFGNVIWFEGYIVSIARRHYILGKCLAVGLLVNLLTTVPALVLYIQAGLLYDWKTYYIDHLRQLLGIFAYGIMLTGVLGLLLMAVAVNVRKTVPLVMIWMGLFVLLPLVGRWLVEGPQFSPLWRLIDLWNDLYLVGLWLLDADFKEVKADRNPTVLQAAVALGVVALSCWIVLRRRVTAIDVIA
jgi:ABC-2 type transport system permease protein